MKITAVITDADIRYHIDQAATELEEDNQIRFPDSIAQAQRAVAGLQIAIDLVEALFTTAELYGLKIRR